MISEKIILERMDNITRKEISKMKFLHNFKGNGLPKSTSLSNGTSVKLEDNNLDKMSIFKGPHNYLNSDLLGDFIGTPKFVEDGRLGYTYYVKPLLKNDGLEELNRGV